MPTSLRHCPCPSDVTVPRSGSRVVGRLNLRLFPRKSRAISQWPCGHAAIGRLNLTYMEISGDFRGSISTFDDLRNVLAYLESVVATLDNAQSTPTHHSSARWPHARCVHARSPLRKAVSRGLARGVPRGRPPQPCLSACDQGAVSACACAN